MTDLIWRLLAWLLSREPIADRLIRRAMRTPYTDIRSPDGQDVYMRRWWLFNPYPSHSDARLRRYAWCPISVRVHQILRPDSDQHLHDHPWNARTVVLMGGYVEERENGRFTRRTGDTATLRHDEFHRIDVVSDRVGAVTLFITGKYRGTWGFKVDGVKVPWRAYLGVEQAQ